MDLADELIGKYKLSQFLVEDIWEQIFQNDSLVSKPQVATYFLEEIERRINFSLFRQESESKQEEMEKRGRWIEILGQVIVFLWVGAWVGVIIYYFSHLVYVGKL
ncbi:MAG TPA: hypothetical protein VGO63_02100 [Candidatus Paceibacterota bacterium]|nr:hypothetical protein [Candidatus Paceibacterota bacterium]